MSATIDEAVRLLRAGGVVGMPTETVYGLAADARRDDAVRRVFELKGRPGTNPLIVHVASVEIAERDAVVSDAARALFARFSPGPLTIVLPLRWLPSPGGRGSQTISPLVTAGLNTVGIRMPDHPVALALLRAFDGPLAAPSANVSNHVSPTTAEHVRAAFGDVVPVLEGGACRVGIESTVLSLAGDRPRILRPGAVTREQIESVIGSVEVFTGHVTTHVAATSPGQQATHYAPRAPAWRFERDEVDAIVRRWTAADTCGAPIALLARNTTIERLRDVAPVAARAMSEDPAIAAHELYATLRELDDASPRAILIEMPPANDPAWAALRDRLTRAARPIADGWNAATSPRR